MPGFTSRLNLYKPGGGSSGVIPDEVVDVDRINDDMDKIDAAIGTPIVTSSTRPAAPFDGQAIFETDTGNLRVWRSSVSRWEFPNFVLTVTDLTALATMSAGDFEGRLIHVDELDVSFQAIDGVWVQVGVARCATAAARDTAYAKAAGAYLVQGAEALLLDTSSVWRYHTAYNATTNKGGALAAGWYPSGGLLYAAYFELSATAVTTQVNMQVATTRDTFALINETTDRVTVGVAGLYRISALRGHSGTTSNSLSIVANGTITLAVSGMTGSAGASSSGSLDTVVPLSVNDYIEFKISAAASTSFSASLARGSVEFAGVKAI